MENTNNDVNTVVDATANLGVGANQTSFKGTVQGASFQSTGGVKDVVNSNNPSGAYDHDGVDDNIQSTLTASLNPITISINFKTSTDKFQALISKFGDGVSAGESYEILVTKSNFAGLRYHASNNFVDISATVRDGKFHHIAATQNGNSYEIYLDGNLIDSGTLLFNSNSVKWHIGSSPRGANFINGITDDARIYNRILTANEISQINSNTK
jgi:hypothetical protein